MRHSLICLGLLFALPLWAQPLGYLPPGTPEVDGMRNLVLIYHGMKSRPVWNKQNLLPYVAYVAALGAGAQRPGEPDFYLAALEQGPRPVSWPDGYVPQTVFWWVAGDAYLGRLSIRHRLTAHLLHEGGNLGFEVRPSARGRGHATAMLAAALPLAAALGVDPARLDCEAGNVASRRVIEKNGGVLDEERDGALFFWVPTA